MCIRDSISPAPRCQPLVTLTDSSEDDDAAGRGRAKEDDKSSDDEDLRESVLRSLGFDFGFGCVHPPATAQKTTTCDDDAGTRP